MKIERFCATLATILCISAAATAYEGEHGDKKMVVGGFLSSGFAMVAGHGYEEWNGISRDYRTAKFAIGGGAYFDFYFTPMFAVDAGFGFDTGGIRFKDGDTKVKEAVTFMEFPVCFKIDYKHFQGMVGLVLSVALSGTTTIKGVVEDPFTGETTNIETKEKWNTTRRWQYVHRANLGPKFAFSYAIPVGPVYVVPGISWTIHLINDLNSDEIHKDDPEACGGEKCNMRTNLLMMNVGVEWGFSSARVVVK